MVPLLSDRAVLAKVTGGAVVDATSFHTGGAARDADARA
jgi:hypothetical protein